MKSEQITIASTAGLHAQLAAKLVNTASKYSVDFRLHYKDKVIDLKSILGLMSLAIPYGEGSKNSCNSVTVVKKLLRM